MKLRFLTLIAVLTALFTSCEEPEEPRYYKIINSTGSTITDIRIYELDENNAVIQSLTAYDEDSEFDDVVYTPNNIREADKDAFAIKVSFKIIGETYTTTQLLRTNGDSEIIIERPFGLTTYTVEFNVNADWDDDSYLHLVEICEYNAWDDIVQRKEINSIYAFGGKTYEYKAHPNTTRVKASFYIFPHRGEDGFETKEFTITYGEYNEFIVYGGECTAFCKSASGEKKALKNKK